MAGIRDLIAAIPPILEAQLAITSPTKALTTCRIWGSSDATHGSIGWTPPEDNSAFAVLKVQGFTTANTETNRMWVTYQVPIFLAVAHSDTPALIENFNDEALAWQENMVQVVAANRRLLPIGTSVSPVDGDTQWMLIRGGIREKHQIFDIPFYGVELDTTVRVVYSVNYQA